LGTIISNKASNPQYRLERNQAFATNSDFLTPLSFLKYQRLHNPVGKIKGLEKFKFVANPIV